MSDLSSSEEPAASELAPRVATLSKSQLLRRYSASTARPRVVYILAPVLAGVALLAYLLLRGQGELPAYAVSLSSGAQAERSAPIAPGEETVLHPDALFEMVARPAAPMDDLAAHAVILRDGARLSFTGKVDVGEDGVVRASGLARDVFPETSGSYEILLTITRPGSSGSRAVRARVRFPPGP